MGFLYDAASLCILSEVLSFHHGVDYEPNLCQKFIPCNSLDGVGGYVGTRKRYALLRWYNLASYGSMCACWP